MNLLYFLYLYNYHYKMLHYSLQYSFYLMVFLCVLCNIMYSERLFYNINHLVCSKEKRMRVEAELLMGQGTLRKNMFEGGHLIEKIWHIKPDKR